LKSNQRRQNLQVAVILPSLARCGPVLVAHKIISSLLHQVDFFVFYFDPIVEVSMPVSCQQIKFTTSIDVSKFDLVHSHMLRPDLYVWFHRLPKKVPVISTLHQYIEESLTYSYGALIAKLFTPIWKMALKRMSIIACINQHMAVHYHKLLPQDAVFEIYNGLEAWESKQVEEHEALLLLKKRYTLVGNIALLIKRKGLEQLIRTLLLDEKLFLILVGEGEERNNLESLALQLGVNNRVKFMGFKENPRDYLPYFDVFVMPSHSEGFGLALVEAVAAKVPVVASQIGSFKEMFPENELCFFELNNIESLYQAILRSQQDKETFIQAAYSRYTASYTQLQMANKYLLAYQQLQLIANEGIT